MTKAILHFSNCERFSVEIDDDNMEAFYDAWDNHSNDAFQTIDTAWIKPCDVVWIEFSEDNCND